MKTKIITTIIGLIFLAAFAYAVKETITLSVPTDIVLKEAKVLSQKSTVEVKTLTFHFDSERIYIYLEGSDTPLELYPDPTDRTPDVDAAIAVMRIKDNLFIQHALDNGYYK